MSAKSCETCCFCQVRTADGECRKDTPRLVDDAGFAVWPIVNLTADWCGEWRSNRWREETAGRAALAEGSQP